MDRLRRRMPAYTSMSPLAMVGAVLLTVIVIGAVVSMSMNRRKIPMTTLIMNQMGGSVSASSQAGGEHAAFRAMDKYMGSSWMSNPTNDPYDPTTGLYTGTNTPGLNVKGAWFRLDIAEPTLFKGMQLRSDSIKSGVILGQTLYGAIELGTFDLSSPKKKLKLRFKGGKDILLNRVSLVATALFPGLASASISEVEYWL